MELTPKQKKILGVGILASLGIFSIIMFTPSSESSNTNQSASFITNETNTVDLSVYEPRVTIDNSGKVKTNIATVADSSVAVQEWQEFLTSEDIPEITEVPVYVIDKNGNKTHIDGPKSAPVIKTNPTKSAPKDDGIKYYKAKGIRANYNNQSTSQQTMAIGDIAIEVPPDDTEKEIRRKTIEGRYGNGGGSSDYQISCVVHTTQILKNGQNLKLRVTQNANLGGVTIPRNTIIFAPISISSNRANIIISNLRINGKISNLNLIGLGEDSQPGILINLDEMSRGVETTLTQEVVTQASTLASQLGVVGQVAGSVGRAIAGGAKTATDTRVKFLDRQTINFIIND